MKLKYYMRGLGIGIILTTLILMIGNPKEKLSDDEIIKRAGELGMVMSQKEDKLDEVLASVKPSEPPSAAPSVTIVPSPVPSVTPQVSPTSQPTSTPVPTPKPTQAPKPTATIAPVATAKPVPSDQDKTKSQGETENTKISFSVKSGMSSGQVAILLQEKGLVKSAEEFNKYIIKVGKASVIRVGSYTLPDGATYDDIITLITTK